MLGSPTAPTPSKFILFLHHFYLFLIYPSQVSLYCAMLCLFAQLCPTLCDPRNCSPPGPLSMGILQARILEWVAMPSSMGSSQPRDRTAGGFFTIWTTREALSLYKYKQIQIYSLLFPFLNKSGISCTLFWTLIFHLTLYYGYLSISYHRAHPFFNSCIMFHCGDIPSFRNSLLLDAYHPDF